MTVILMAGIALMWGSAFILLKQATGNFQTLSIAACRLLTGAAVIAVFILLNKRKTGFKRGHLPGLAFITLVGYIIPFIIVPFLVSRYDSSFISIVVSLLPIMTVLVSIPMLGKFPNRYELMGVLGGFGCILLLYFDAIGRDIKLLHLLIWVSIPLCYAVGNTFIARKLGGLDPVFTVMVCMLTSGLLILPAALALETVTVDIHFGSALASLMVLGAVCTGFATALFYRLLYKSGPLAAGMVSYFIPVVALAWGWMAGEKVTLLQVGALCGILGMVAVTGKNPVN